ncbi:MAG: HAMP domain-containing histidine kinase [Eubacterium sp.]|nr:HAMP domain-containing histidine kinase [Eubacterium sp.]
MDFSFSHSIRFKIAIIVFLSTIITIFISWSVSNHFIERFFVTHTRNSLITTFRSCNDFFDDDKNIISMDNDEIVGLQGYIQNPANASVFIVNPKNFTVYSSIKINDQTADALQTIIDSYDFSLFTEKNPYKIVRNTVSEEESLNGIRSIGSYYDLIGKLNNGYIVVLRTPVDSLHDSITFSTRLFTGISFALLLFEILIVLFVSNMFSKPIIQMNRVARRMSNLDFSAKVEVKNKDEIGELGDSMNIMSKRLEKSIKELKRANLELSNDIREHEHIEEMRQEFLSHVSHELKTPLALIQGYAEGLKSGVADDQETRDYYLDVIMDEATKMNELVMKLIDLNQLETGDDISIERVDITALIGEVVHNSKILLQDNDTKIEFEYKNELYVWADSFMIEQVVTNYLTNAIHHVKKDGKIKIFYQADNDKLRINVYNDGDPIPDESLEKVFIKFYKTDPARTRSYGGSGIGLSIVAAIMKAHNMDYGVYNSDNGVVFYFELETVAQGQISSD